MRGLRRRNGGWVIGGRDEERGRMASDKNKEEFWCVSEVGIECQWNRQRNKSQTAGAQRKKVHLLGGYEQAALNDASAS